MRNWTSDLSGVLKVGFLMGTQNFFFVPRLWQDEKTSFLILHWAQNLPSLLFCQKHYTIDTKSLELSNRPHSPKSLCGSVVEHRSANLKVWGSIPHGDSELFFVPCSLTRWKNIFLNLLSNVDSQKDLSEQFFRSQQTLFIHN